MIDYKANAKTKSMEFLVGGKITARDYDRVMDKFKKDLKRFDEVKVLERVEDIDGIDPKALISNIGSTLSQFNEINKKVTKCAVVADQKWVEWLTKASSVIMKGEIKHFKLKEEAKARKWLRGNGH